MQSDLQKQCLAVGLSKSRTKEVLAKSLLETMNFGASSTQLHGKSDCIASMMAASFACLCLDGFGASSTQLHGKSDCIASMMAASFACLCLYR